MKKTHPKSLITITNDATLMLYFALCHWSFRVPSQLASFRFPPNHLHFFGCISLSTELHSKMSTRRLHIGHEINHTLNQPDRSSSKPLHCPSLAHSGYFHDISDQFQPATSPPQPTSSHWWKSTVPGSTYSAFLNIGFAVWLSVLLVTFESDAIYHVLLVLYRQNFCLMLSPFQFRSVRNCRNIVQATLENPYEWPWMLFVQKEIDLSICIYVLQVYSLRFLLQQPFKSVLGLAVLRNNKMKHQTLGTIYFTNSILLFVIFIMYA